MVDSPLPTPGCSSFVPLPPYAYPLLFLWATVQILPGFSSAHVSSGMTPEEGVLFWDSSDKGGVERVSQSELDWDNELCHRLGIVSDVASEAEMYWLFPVKKYIPMLMTRASSHLRIRAWVIENIEMPICRFSNFQVWRRKNLVLIVARESNYISWTMSFRKQYSK